MKTNINSCGAVERKAINLRIKNAYQIASLEINGPTLHLEFAMTMHSMR